MNELNISGINFTYTDRDGWEAESELTGHKYNLFEGVSLCGQSSSDIVFIFDYELDSKELTGGRVIDFVYGVSFLDEDFFESIAMHINSYERKVKNNYERIFIK